MRPVSPRLYQPTTAATHLLLEAVVKDQGHCLLDWCGIAGKQGGAGVAVHDVPGGLSGAWTWMSRFKKHRT